MKMRFIVMVALLSAVCVLSATGRASAAASCVVSSPTAMSFGNYDVFGGASAVSGTMTITCTGHGAPKPKAQLGTGFSGTTADRYMKCTSGSCLTGFSADHLHYNLYTTVAHATIWGNTSATDIASTPTSCADRTCTWTVFGLIPAAISGGTNDVAVGGYTDSIVITVAY